jgi:hypothetical protein
MQIVIALKVAVFRSVSLVCIALNRVLIVGAGQCHNAPADLQRESAMKRESRNRRQRFLHDLKWIAILWGIGFGATVLLTLPFHFLVMAMIHK